MTNLRSLPGGSSKIPDGETIAFGAALAALLWVVLFVVFTVLGTVFFLIAWNLGVVGLAGAVGLAVSTVSVATAFGAVFLLRIVRRVLGSIGRMHINPPPNSK